MYRHFGHIRDNNPASIFGLANPRQVAEIPLPNVVQFPHLRA
jgi:hypothetical protein